MRSLYFMMSSNLKIHSLLANINFYHPTEPESDLRTLSQLPPSESHHISGKLNQKVLSNSRLLLRRSIIPEQTPDPSAFFPKGTPASYGSCLSIESFEQLHFKIEKCINAYEARIKEEVSRVLTNYWRLIKQYIPTYYELTEAERNTPEILRIQRKIHRESRRKLDFLYKELRTQIHKIIELPKSQRADIRLKYSNPSGTEPYQYRELNAAVRQFIGNALLEIKIQRHSSDTKSAVEWLSWAHSAGDSLELTNDLKTTKILLLNIAVLMKRLPEKSKAKRNLKAAQNGLITMIGWADASPQKRQQLLQIPKEHKRGLDFFCSLTSRQIMPAREIQISNLPYNSSADYEGKYINIDKMHLQTCGGEAQAVVHELAHCLEAPNPHLLIKSIEYRRKRSTLSSDSLFVLRNGILKGDWEEKGGEAYSGKVYRNHEGKDISSEVLSTGVARLFRDPVEFFKNDPDFFSYVVNTLRGR